MHPILRLFAKPEYLLRPGQLLRRFSLGRYAIVPDKAVVELPWGLPFEVSPAENIGSGIWRLGVHELVVSEVLWRLIDPGEPVADIGANSGYFSGLMGCRTQEGGVVSAFEPHPRVRTQLETNMARWRGLKGMGRVEVFSFALSDILGIAELCVPTYFEMNTGTAYIGEAKNSAPVGRAIQVETRRLDEVFAPGSCPMVIKIDVEGHEARVLSGAGELLGEAGVRDIVFEEYRAYPSESTSLLESRGYTIYKIERGFFGPSLLAPGGSDAGSSWDAPNFLATRDSARALARLGKAGWACLSCRPLR